MSCGIVLSIGGRYSGPHALLRELAISHPVVIEFMYKFDATITAGMKMSTGFSQ